MKKDVKQKMVYGFIILLILLGTYFTLSSLNLVGGEKVMLEDLGSCNTENDCYDLLINKGVLKLDLDDALDSSELICENNQCGVILK